MLEQERIIENLRSLWQAEDRVQAAMLYGSIAIGEGDKFSDVDCYFWTDYFTYMM
jgi:predicted nucleotidyltransferase